MRTEGRHFVAPPRRITPLQLAPAVWPRRTRTAVVAFLAVTLLLTACTSATRGGGTASSPSPTSPEVTAPSAAAAPRARAYAVMTDAPGEGVLLLGGQFGVPPGTPLSDLWSFSPGEGWTELEPETGRGGDAFAYDSDSKLAVLLGLTQEGTYDAIWTFDQGTREWQELRMAAPHPRYVWGARMAYDSRSDRMILFGGIDARLRPHDETWALDLAAGKWEQMSPQESPPAQNFHVMAYDPKEDRVILFSGRGQKGTWAYDYDADTWTDLRPKGSPEARDYSAMVYDPVGMRMILFGGVDLGEEPFGDTWAFDFRKNAWTNLEPPTAPSPRGWHSMAFDAETKSIVLFSGGETRDTDLDDVWLFDPSTDTWSQVT